MGGRGSALCRRAILLAMVSTTGWLTGCGAQVAPAPEERVAQTEGALIDLNRPGDVPDPGDKGDPSAPGDLGDPGNTSDPGGNPGGSHEDPEPQPWVPNSAEVITVGDTVIHYADGTPETDPEPQPWMPDEGKSTSPTTTTTKPR